jgi:hypothetical protein
MLDLLLLTTTIALAEPDSAPAPSHDQEAETKQVDADAAVQTEAAQTDRDRRAVAEHLLNDAGLNLATSSRTLFPELLTRETELRALRLRLADLELRVAQQAAQLHEMQAFVLDHDRYGTDYTQYRTVRRQAEEEARRRAALERRGRRELARQQQEQEQARKAEQSRIVTTGQDLKKTLREMNFGLIGQHVWASRSAYAYGRIDHPDEHITYNPSPFGRNRVTSEHHTELDWKTMTISGSVLNAADETRNIGIAFAFFDEHGNQVGAETVVVNNARTGVPYPFTQILKMAATKPFASSTSWVLFSDPITPAQVGAATP